MWKLTIFLTLVWALSLLYGEMFAFWIPSLWTCSWPPPPSSMDKVDNPGDYVKIAVLTDPQLMDKTSLNLAPKSLALEMAQFYTDLFMRRAFLSSVLPFRPDIILFLGDYFDGGPFLSDEEWQESWSRFKHIFNLDMVQQTKNIKLFYLSGNHDIGYSAFHPQMPEVISRYEKVFGVRNYHFKVGKVNFIAVDAQTLDGHPQGNESAATWKFIEDVSKNITSSPSVLLTHIPLYRPDDTSCGPHRSSSIINQRINRAEHDEEIVYQNYVTEEQTNYLLELIKPALILSGHDHDQCTVVHTTKYGAVKEHTLGTISWQQGNLFPSFMLLSVSNLTSSDGSKPADAISTTLCFLPVQTFIYIWYLLLLIMTVLIVLFWPTYGLPFLHHLSEYTRSLISLSMFGGGVKEKNDDEICEYEEVWDAEGTMHLIRKTSKARPTYSSESSSERGNAVMRSAARKQNVEIDITMPADAVKLPSRANKSKMKLVIRQLLRVFRTIFIIAAFNVPLYMMLLFKDWIDK
ncbi:PREDICTED: uncharacterized protein C630.12 [Ipomoea nil]|uniref:uncharacterized protein C630.12 n=1 Tax=Ipomoea nil TaxID=35883 RepID=UPI000901B6C8|nr:PREDICTED: uncharacterized protein C630.12 [Ipomoea nil]XP_019196714.1 PREDICTED: uncharacterized protein C630.12 [Ipomoea nil]